MSELPVYSFFPWLRQGLGNQITANDFDAAVKLRAAIPVTLQLTGTGLGANLAAPITHIYNPLEYAWTAHEQYLRQFGGGKKRVVFLGMNPGLARGAVLVSCPCELARWRVGRRAWGRSENPLDWAGRTPASVHVIALTGTSDDNTGAELAKTYVAALDARGIDAVFAPIAGATHNSAFRAPEVTEAISKLIR